MGNSNCGCKKNMSGGKKIKRGGSSCGSRKTRKQRKSKKHMKKAKKQSGGCGCNGVNASSATQYGGYKYDRKSSVDAIKRLKHRVSKNTKTRSKHKKYGKRKHYTRKTPGRKR